MRPQNRERNQKFADLFRELKSTRLVADVTGYPIKTVHHTLHQMGIATPKAGRLLPYSACEKNREVVLKMCEDGNSLNEIAQAVGTTGIRVKQFLRRNGVTKDFPNVKYGPRHYAWKGGTVDRDGYVLIYAKGHPHARKNTHYVFEHRLVMEKSLGRYLLPTEVVHHKDGVRNHNSIENLQLFQANSEHLSFELKGRRPKWTEDGWARIRRPRGPRKPRVQTSNQNL